MRICREGSRGVMHDGWMMWGMGVAHLLAIALVVLVIAALIKYVFFR
jgi:hypothetical protein